MNNPLSKIVPVGFIGDSIGRRHETRIPGLFERDRTLPYSLEESQEEIFGGHMAKKFRSTTRARDRISETEFNAMWESQNGQCAICHWFDPSPDRSRLYLDHCHDYGHVRELVCNNCNSGLGFFSDDIGRLKAAIAYLERNRHPQLGWKPHWDQHKGKVMSEAEFVAVQPLKSDRVRDWLMVASK